MNYILKLIFLKKVLSVCFIAHDVEINTQVTYIIVSQPLRDRDPVNTLVIRRGPSPNKFTRT